MSSKTYRGTGVALLGTTLAVTLLLLILGGVFWGQARDWEGRNNSACNDYNPCTANLILPDGTCVTPPRTFHNGTDCASEDRCYFALTEKTTGDAVTKQCNAGTCTADTQYCKGFCNADADCTDYPLPLRYGALNVSAPPPEIDVFCYAHSCVTAVVGGQTSDCASWIDTSDSANRYTEQCLFMSFDDFGGDFDPGVCFFRYQCAPFDYYIPPPTPAPTEAPTTAPTAAPTKAPTAAPTAAPTVAPTAKKRDVVDTLGAMGEERRASQSRQSRQPKPLATGRPAHQLVVRPRDYSAYTFPGPLRMQFAREPMTRALYAGVAQRIEQGRMHK